MDGQSDEALRSRIDELKRLARNKTWRPDPPSELSLQLTSFDLADSVPSEPLVNLVRALEERTRTSLYLEGGNFGCFDARFHVKSDAGVRAAKDAMNDAITSDPAIQMRLNEARVHSVKVESPTEIARYRAFNDADIGIATNRKRAKPGSERPTLAFFGSGDADQPTFAIAALSISDASRNQPTENLLKRAWRRIRPDSDHNREDVVLLRDLKIYSAADFPAAIGSVPGSETLVFVHGYANTFEHAISSCALNMHRARLQDLGIVPVVFSWPAAGNPAKYTPT